MSTLLINLHSSLTYLPKMDQQMSVARTIMLQAAYSDEGQQHLKLDIRNSLTGMQTAQMHFDWVREEEELEGDRAMRWNDIYKRFQLLSIETKDACSRIENFGKQFNGEILKFVTDKSKTIAECRAFVGRFIEETERCDDHTETLAEKYGRLSKDLTAFERLDYAPGKRPQLSSRANSDTADSQVSVSCVLDSTTHPNVAPLANALSAGHLPNSASTSQLKGTAVYFSPETFTELQRQVVTFNNAARKPSLDTSVPAVSRDFEGIYERIAHIRSHLTVATGAWSSIHGQCVQIKNTLGPATGVQTEDPEVIKVYLEAARVIVLFLSAAMVEYVRGIKFIDWKLWWTSKAQRDEVVNR